MTVLKIQSFVLAVIICSFIQSLTASLILAYITFMAYAFTQKFL